MKLKGQSRIAGQPFAGAAATIHGFNPASNEKLEPAYSMITEGQLTTATTAAAAAFDSFSTLDPQTHASFLEAIAANIQDLGEELISRACQETGLPAARLRGEMTRTTSQLRLFAAVVRQGDFRGVRVDPALPDRTPLPRFDIRQRQVPLGPVAVFGASNFPLAFSTAGGDTASALAAGCPVVFKAHNAHPGTSELVGQAIVAAVQDAGLHPGVFSLIYGPGNSIGQALVADPAIKAVGFTGSQSAGTALLRTAAARPEPIPVYAEMSASNPVIVLPGALTGNIEALARNYVAAVTGSSGQLCTSPGILFAPAGEAGDELLAAVARAVSGCTGQTMLSAAIADSFAAGVRDLDEAAGVARLATGLGGPTANAPAPVIFAVELADFLANPVLHAEIFGAASLVVRYSDPAELRDAVNQLEGQLTATLQLAAEDYSTATMLLPLLERKAGRVIINGWPTGVEVGYAMVHGGPFPASSDSRSTSVGALAINRFLRPVAYQNFPKELLPPAVQDANPWQLTRSIDGTLVPALVPEKEDANA